MDVVVATVGQRDVGVLPASGTPPAWVPRVANGDENSREYGELLLDWLDGLPNREKVAQQLHLPLIDPVRLYLDRNGEPMRRLVLLGTNQEHQEREKYSHTDTATIAASPGSGGWANLSCSTCAKNSRRSSSTWDATSSTAP